MVEYYQYAVKFISGKSGGKILAPGRYWTAINVHNPINNPIELIMKFAVALPGKPGPISKYTKMKLGGDQAFEIDRKQVAELVPERLDFIKGFVVIRCKIELDVVAVYTAAGRDELVETMHIERVSPWKLRLVDEQDIEPKIPPEDWQLVASHRFP